MMTCGVSESEMKSDTRVCRMIMVTSMPYL